MGYRLLTAFWEARAAARMEASLDSDQYDPAELIGATNQLRTARDDFFRLVNDLQKSGHSRFPGPSGKTNPLLNKIVWCNSTHFPHLHHFAIRPVLSPRLLRTALSPGHPRIGLQPPRQSGPLS